MAGHRLPISRRTVLAIGGAAGISFSNFLLSLLLVKTVSPADFGLFGFIQVIVGLGYGASNALCGSPLLVALNRTETPQPGVAESFFKASFGISFVASCFLVVVVQGFGERIVTSLLFGLSALFLWMRWFARSCSYAMHDFQSVARSDACYCAITLSSAVSLFSLGTVSITAVAGIQALGAGFGILALGRTLLAVQARGIGSGSLSPFFTGFREQGRHALIGVVSTEATANAHAYIVTLLLGTAAFAPLAAAALIYRPIPIIIQSLTQLERPRLARMLRDAETEAAWRLVYLFRKVVLGFWTVNLLLALLVFTFFVEKIVREDHDPQAIAVAALLWGLIMGLRCLRGPESALLQANGNFRPLSHVTVFSSLISIPLVFLSVYFFGAVWSLCGVLVGEIVAAQLTIWLARKHLSSSEEAGMVQRQ